jgi:hypothetical protein
MNNSENKKGFGYWFWAVANVIMFIILLVCLIDYKNYNDWANEQEEKRKK